LTCLFVVTALTLVALPSLAQVMYSGVAFAEVGLPSGTQWSVICNGTLYQTTTSTISISLSVGTYNFSVPDISGYNASPKSGNVTAILDPIKLTTITFSPSIPEFNINPATLGFLILVTLFFSQFITKKKKTRNGYQTGENCRLRN
jgi:hypothetical protein